MHVVDQPAAMRLHLWVSGDLERILFSPPNGHRAQLRAARVPPRILRQAPGAPATWPATRRLVGLAGPRRWRPVGSNALLGRARFGRQEIDEARAEHEGEARQDAREERALHGPPVEKCTSALDSEEGRD